MCMSPTALTRAAGVAAVAAGLIFVGVQINHPTMDATSITTTEVMVRNSLKVSMAALALVGLTGLYLSQVRRNGLLGLIGYLIFATGYLVIMSTSFLAACVLPAIADSNPAYVNDVLRVFNGGHAIGDIGLLQLVFQIQSVGYLVGGLLFGIALIRAGVVARWASALLAAAGLLSILLTVLPDAFHRLLAFPNGIALIGLGVSLWRRTPRDPSPAQTPVSGRSFTPVGAQ